jgi:diguanylate cyclase (GGDEF)-like protein
MTIDAALDSMPPGGKFGAPCEVDVFGELTRTWVVSAPLVRPDQPAGAGSVVILASRSSLSGTWQTWALSFALPLVGVGAIAVAIGLRWIRARLATPLRMMVRRAHEDESQWRTRLPVHRDDELGAISRTIEEIIGELSDARAGLDEQRRGLHLRVAERTRQINRMLRDAQQKVWLDPLTQLGNRRLLDDRLGELFDAQRGSGGRLSVAMFDVDDFKAHNDTYGHAAGDDLLRFLGQLLRGSVRETDVAVRYAGDEFVLLLPDIGPEDALALAERIVRFFAQQKSAFEEEPHPTLSAGVAAMPNHNAATGEELLAQADGALYQAKALGKNTVCLAVLGAPATLNPDKSAGLAWRTNPPAA